MAPAGRKKCKVADSTESVEGLVDQVPQSQDAASVPLFKVRGETKGKGLEKMNYLQDNMIRLEQEYTDNESSCASNDDIVDTMLEKKNEELEDTNDNVDAKLEKENEELKERIKNLQSRISDMERMLQEKMQYGGPPPPSST